MERAFIEKQVLFFSLLFFSLASFSQTFSEVTSLSLPAVSNGSTEWGDYDNDGDLDLLISGGDNSNAAILRIFTNNGEDSFTDTDTKFDPEITGGGIWSGSVFKSAWCDFNLDGFLDLIFVGPNPMGVYELKIYCNNGDGTFSQEYSFKFITFQGGSSFDCGDYDNDGDPDIILTSSICTRIFRNTGVFVFNELFSARMTGFTNSSARWIDYDNDGDLDILLTGSSDIASALIYRNDNNDVFVAQAGFNLSSSSNTGDWGDYDNDGYMDVVTGGDRPVYKNMGGTSFEKQTSILLPVTTNGTSKWGDLDNDGDLDLVITGFKYDLTDFFAVYINNGNNTFTDQNIDLTAVSESSADLGDYDNDGDLDIVLSGKTGPVKTSKLYRNNLAAKNYAPDAPAGLSYLSADDGLILKWDPVNSDNTGGKSLTYNVMIGTSPGSSDVTDPASLPDGFRKIADIGNGQTDTTFLVRNLKPGTYYWKVQAVDNGFLGGRFSTGSEFKYTAEYQSYGLHVKDVQSTRATLTWSRGNGDNSIVFIKHGTEEPSVPVDQTNYTASTKFGAGSQIGSTGWYCVYNGDQNSVIVENLQPSSEYTVLVFEYNVLPGGEAYFDRVSDNNSENFRTGIFTELTGAIPMEENSDFSLVSFTDAEWFDLDNDDDLDVLFLMDNNWKLYQNNGDNTFTKLAATFDYGETASCADFNNDGLIDITILSSDGTIIYKNNGDKTFTSVPGITIPGTNYGSVDWGDYDIDGDLDLLLTGESGSLFECITRLYRNNGNETFTEMMNHDITGVRIGSTDWGDYNNDGFPDVALSGITLDGKYTTRVFRNEKDGSFKDIGQIFSNKGMVMWGDYDNDGDLDILVSSSNPNLVYRNDGNDVFTRQDQISIGSMMYGAGSWGDYNNDGYLDIAITGYTGMYLPFSRVYRNNGDNTFQADSACMLTQAGSSIPAWADFDGDNDLDLLLLGVSADSSFVKLYRNDISVENIPPDQPEGPVSKVYKSDVKLSWNPVEDGNTEYGGITYNLMIGKMPDGPDVMTPHSSPEGFRRLVDIGNANYDTVALLKNLPLGDYYWRVQAVDNSYAGGPFSGQGQFSVVPVQSTNLNATIIDNNSLSLKWERGNGSRCIVFCKETATGYSTPADNESYLPDTEFGFGEQLGTTGWYCIYNGRGDSVVVTGLKYKTDYSFHVIEYLGEIGNEQYFDELVNGNPGVFSTGLFSEQKNVTLSNPGFNNYAWGDYDNNGFVDLLIPGNPTRLFRNNGDNSFTETNSILPDLNYGTAAWGDYDNDGYLDLVFTGGVYTSRLPAFSGIYRNNGSGAFEEQTQIQLEPVYQSSADWGDYDNDGDLDLVIAGATGNDPYFNPVTKLYRNNGDNTFSEQTHIELKGIYRGEVKWVDYDNDGDLDLYMAGIKDYLYNNGISAIYRNNGDNTFTEQIYLALPGLWEASVDWGDYDNDGDLDVVMTQPGQLYVYRNDGGSFTQALTRGYGYSSYGSVCWGDYDNDGYLDILFSNFSAAAIIFRNDNGKGFYELDDASFNFTLVEGIEWCDYDNDGDIDIVYNQYGDICRLYKNNLFMKSGQLNANNPPSSPAVLSTEHSPGGIKLSWSPVFDDETKPNTLSYNLKIGTSYDSENILSSHSGSSGFRKIVKSGNVQLDTTHFLADFPTGRYYWRVQAVDQGFKGGAWSAVDSFEIRNVQAFYSTNEVCLGFPTTFTDQSVAQAGITYWKWDFRDGTTSSSQNPSHTYVVSGTYNVKLVVADPGGTKDSLEQAVVVRPKPLAGFDAPSVCQGIPVTVTNTTNINGLTISSWSWDFGDESSSSVGQPAPHPYLTAADYTIKLKAIASNGCADSVSSVVSVGSYPVAAVTANAPLSFCKGDSVKLSVPLISEYIYNWKLSGTALTGASENELIAGNTGSYVAEITNPKGNCTSVSPPVSVTVLDAPSAPFIVAAGDLTFCQGDSVLLSVVNTPGNSYGWKLNGGAVGIDKNSYAAKASGEYSLTISNASGCNASSVNKITVAVNPGPSVPNISKSGATTFCEGGSVLLSVPEVQGNVYNWNNDNSPTGVQGGSFTATSSGSYSLDITNSFGCSVTTLPVNVTVKESPAIPLLDSLNYVKGKCPGDNPLTLSAKEVNDNYQYLWYKDGVPIDNSLPYIDIYEAGFYKLSAGLDGCISESKVFNADFPAGPAKPMIYAQGPSFWYLACSDTTASKYSWYFNGKLIEGADKYYYLANYRLGDYQVSIANKDLCFTRSDIITIPPGYTGADGPEPLSGVLIYPNPTTGSVNITMDNNYFGELSLEIFSIGGKKVVSKKFEKTTEHFRCEADLRGQPKGMYIVNLVLDKISSEIKLILE